MTQSGRIQIHLTIHQEGEDVRIDFPFDIHNDSIDQVVSELNEQCNFTPEEILDLKQMIEAQIQKKTQAAKAMRNSSGNAFEPIQISEEKNSDDEFMDDPEYAALIEQQKKEMTALQERHLKEQQELTANGTIQSASPPHKCDDLLLFY